MRPSAPTQDSTLPEDPSVVSTRGGSAFDTLAMVVVWHAEGVSALGECLLLPPGSPGSWRVFGRGSSQPTDPHPRLELVRHRPWGLEPAPPLTSSHLSRVQLRIRAHGLSHVEIESVGLCPMIFHGNAVQAACVSLGDTVRLGKQLALMCVRRCFVPRGEPLFYGPSDFGQSDPYGMVGESESAWQLRTQIAFVAARPGHALILGPSGAGKELVAHAIHAISVRRNRPMVSRNAATIPEGILDAELFGNVRNYPNAGMPERPGLVGQANGSTLFLDELAELPTAAQAHLLRLLDSGEYQRLGDARPLRSDLRLVAATNRPESALKSDVAARFQFRVVVPGLHERREDIPLLVLQMIRSIAQQDPVAAIRFFPDHDVRRHPRISPAFIDSVVDHTYHTHVRQLQRLVWQAIEASPSDTLMLSPDQALDACADAPSRPPPSAPAAPFPADHSVRTSDLPPLLPSRIQEVLDEHNGVIEHAWPALGLPSRHALARLIAKHGIEVRRTPGLRRRSPR